MFRKLFGKEFMCVKEIDINTALMLILSAILILMVIAKIYNL